MKIHPFANQFPMLSSDELQDLAQDIAEHGLIHPIVRDRTGQIIDGRNRLAACKLAKIDPTFVTHDGDPIPFIISANVHRRHIPKSTQAMAIAIAYPEPERGGDRKSKQFQAKSLDLNRSEQTMLWQARTVLRVFGEDHEYVRQIMQGGSLEQAYQYAKIEKARQEEEKLQLEQLKNDYPGIYIQVNAGNLTPAQGFAAAKVLEQSELEKKKRQEIHLVIQELAESPITITEPSANLSVDVDNIVPQTNESPIEHIQAQETFIKNLIKISRDLKSLESSIPTFITEESRGWNMAVRSALASSINALNRIGNTVNNLKPKLRSVK